MVPSSLESPLTRTWLYHAFPRKQTNWFFSLKQSWTAFRKRFGHRTNAPCSDQIRAPALSLRPSRAPPTAPLSASCTRGFSCLIPPRSRKVPCLWEDERFRQSKIFGACFPVNLQWILFSASSVHCFLRILSAFDCSRFFKAFRSPSNPSSFGFYNSGPPKRSHFGPTLRFLQGRVHTGNSIHAVLIMLQDLKAL